MSVKTISTEKQLLRELSSGLVCIKPIPTNVPSCTLCEMISADGGRYSMGVRSKTPISLIEQLGDKVALTLILHPGCGPSYVYHTPGNVHVLKWQVAISYVNDPSRPIEL